MISCRLVCTASASYRCSHAFTFCTAFTVQDYSWWLQYIYVCRVWRGADRLPRAQACGPEWRAFVVAWTARRPHSHQERIMSIATPYTDSRLSAVAPWWNAPAAAE